MRQSLVLLSQIDINPLIIETQNFPPPHLPNRKISCLRHCVVRNCKMSRTKKCWEFISCQLMQPAGPWTMGSRAPVLLSACSWRVPWDWWWHANISSGVVWIWTWLYASRKKTTAGLPEFLASISSSFSSCRILPVPTHIPQKIRSFSFQMCEMANRNGKRRKGKKKDTHAGSLVVFKKVVLQTSHWISLADSLTFSCDFATPFSASFWLRARLEAAFAPCEKVRSPVFRMRRS